MSIIELEYPLRAVPTRQVKSQRPLPAASCRLTRQSICLPQPPSPRQLPPAPAMPAPYGPKLDHPKVDPGINWNSGTSSNAGRMHLWLDPTLIQRRHLPSLYSVPAMLYRGQFLISYQNQLRCDGRHEGTGCGCSCYKCDMCRAGENEQELDEPFRSFIARVHVKAEICQYTTKYACTPPQTVDFTDIIILEMLCWLESLICTYAKMSSA